MNEIEEVKIALDKAFKYFKLCRGIDEKIKEIEENKPKNEKE